VKKRKSLKAFLILGILLSVAGGFAESVKANPLSQAQYAGTNEPSSKASIIVSSTENTPINNTIHNQNSLSLFLNVSYTNPNNIPHSFYSQAWYYTEYLSKVYFKADWQQNETHVYTRNYYQPRIDEFNHYLNFTGIPEGKHNVTFYAVQDGIYAPSLYEYYSLGKKISSSVFFVIDTVCPNVSISSVQNITYNTPDITLNFEVDEPVLQTSYSLDGQDNITIAGNITLNGLSNGVHNVTVYATDGAGNVGASETTYFSVEEPFPALPIATASIASVAFLGVGLIYFKKNKR
jgi:hypothetical protein